MATSPQWSCGTARRDRRPIGLTLLVEVLLRIGPSCRSRPPPPWWAAPQVSPLAGHRHQRCRRPKVNRPARRGEPVYAPPRPPCRTHFMRGLTPVDKTQSSNNARRFPWSLQVQPGTGLQRPGTDSSEPQHHPVGGAGARARGACCQRIWRALVEVGAVTSLAAPIVTAPPARSVCLRGRSDRASASLGIPRSRRSALPGPPRLLRPALRRHCRSLRRSS